MNKKTDDVPCMDMCCSYLQDICPYNIQCKDCIIEKAIQEARDYSKREREKYVLSR